MTNSYNRSAELKAFDETKSGVKGLVDSGITKIPSIFIHNNSKPYFPPPKNEPSPNNIPIIDLQGMKRDPDLHHEILQRIRHVSETWGFFQVVNHGIPNMVLEEMLEGVKRFHEQDSEVKKGYYTRDLSKKVVYNSNYDLYSGQSTNWRDTFYCLMAPYPPNPQEIPSTCREILMEYTNQVMKLGIILMELLSEALGLKPSYLNENGCSEGLAIVCHYYPACPQPELTLGTSKHSDDSFLTLLLQDQIGGLQILYQDKWFDVPYVHGALVVNIGDLLQLISNDKFKSNEHRVLANKIGPRVSVASFFSTSFQSTTKTYEPIKELISDDNPPKYRKISVQEYVSFAHQKGLDGVSPLLNFRL